MIIEKPKAFVDLGTSAAEQLQRMLKVNPKLYEECTDTLGFAYGFSQLANRAFHFDYLLRAGIIPSDYIGKQGE